MIQASKLDSLTDWCRRAGVRGLLVSLRGGGKEGGAVPETTLSDLAHRGEAARGARALLTWSGAGG